jgi:glycosyltransferase involved in cell wall biosynthesis
MLSPEFPPTSGGVGDYVFLLANALAERGDQVHVWCSGSGRPEILPSGVEVHPALGNLNPTALWRVGRAIDQFPKPRHIVLQWVPHSFGWRSMNLPFCLWMWGRARLRGDDLGIMVHEPFLAFREGNWRQDAAALVHRVMTILLMHAARRIWVSTPRWEKAWKPYGLGRRIPFSWLPLPSNVPVLNDAAATAATRARYVARDQQIVGHFGTFGRPITPMLEAIVPALLDKCDRTVMLLIGPRGAEFRDGLLRENPRYQDRIHVTGSFSASDPRLSAHLSACDLMIQPYPDGVSSRRTSLLAPLAHGVPVVTTSGPSTESLWPDSEAVAFAPAGDTDAFVAQARAMLSDQYARRRVTQAARSLYQKYFAIERIAEGLRSAYRGGVPQDPAQTQADRC